MKIFISAIFASRTVKTNMNLHLHLNPALLAAPALAGGYQDAVAMVGHPENLDAVVDPLLWPDLKGLQNPAMAVLLRRDTRQLRRLRDDDVLIAKPQHALYVVPTEGVESVANDLHVLRRHRPRSISRG